MSTPSIAQAETLRTVGSAQARTADASDVARTASLREETAAARESSAFDIAPRTRSELANRVMNVAIASLALVIASPAMLIAALAVRLTSKGPIFYRQVRVGIDQRWKQKGRRGHCRRA